MWFSKAGVGTLESRRGISAEELKSDLFFITAVNVRQMTKQGHSDAVILIETVVFLVYTKKHFAQAAF